MRGPDPGTLSPIPNFRGWALSHLLLMRREYVHLFRSWWQVQYSTLNQYSYSRHTASLTFWKQFLNEAIPDVAYFLGVSRAHGALQFPRNYLSWHDMISCFPSYLLTSASTVVLCVSVKFDWNSILTPTDFWTAFLLLQLPVLEARKEYSVASARAYH